MLEQYQVTRDPQESMVEFGSFQVQRHKLLQHIMTYIYIMTQMVSNLHYDIKMF